MKTFEGLGLPGILVMAVALSGCGTGQFPVAPVSGVVMCDGKPVPGALVYFAPQQSGDNALVGKVGLGVVDDQGKFTVRTYGSDDGAVVGMHDVRVERGNGPGCDCAMNPDRAVAQVEVKDGENNFTIELPPKTRLDERAEREEVLEDDD